MGRSVSVPSGAKIAAYFPVELEDGFEFGQVIDDFRYNMKELSTSMRNCTVWLGREDCAYLENELVYAGISEYCGLVAAWVVLKGDYPELSEAYINRIAKGFLERFSQLKLIGRASNGEAFFREI